jgi:thiol-disulfide isomerase/thioredoxin
MRRRTVALTLVLLLVLSCAGCTQSQPEQSGGILSSFTAVDLDGNPVDQSVLQSARLTMINVWATYCGPCISEMPDLGKLAGKYGPSGLQIIGLVTDVQDAAGHAVASQVELAKDIVAQTGADYLHLIPGTDMIGLLQQITAVPTTFFVDASGHQVGGTYLGAKSAGDWAEIIENLLEEVQ